MTKEMRDLLPFWKREGYYDTVAGNSASRCERFSGRVASIFNGAVLSIRSVALQRRRKKVERRYEG